MVHQQVRFDLTHGIEHHPDNNQETGTAKKFSDCPVNIKRFIHDVRQNRNHRKENCPRQRQTRHCTVQIVGGRPPRTNTRNISTPTLKVIRDLYWIKLRRNPEVGEKQNH